MGRYGSTTKWLLEALIPTDDSWYTPKKHGLITQIAKKQQLKTNTVRNAFHRAIKNGLIEVDELDLPRLTAKGRATVAPFVAKDLPGSLLLVIFDIAEADRKKRDHLRFLLKELEFKQVQLSVWATTKDHREYLRTEIKALDLDQSVLIYEAKQL